MLCGVVLTAPLSLKKGEIMKKIDLKMNKEDAGSIESNKYYLYCFSVYNQIAKKDFQFNVKLEEGKIIFELNIDKDTQNAIFGEFVKLMKDI